jgi:hypothetical protein
MSVELKDLEVGSIVVDIRGCLAIVLETNHTPTYPIIFATKASGSRYKGRPTDFRTVIGKADINAFNGASTMSSTLSVSGGMDLFLPEPLRSMGLKIGDPIKVKHGYAVVNAIFDGYKMSRPKYPVSYIIDGKRWKGMVSAIVGKAA